MSTEHQQYSLENQGAAIQRYAEENHLDVVATYVDAGRSGLQLRNRRGLQQLLKDVISSTPTFSAIVVYDVSRWGRFQDIDEAAHYEFVCRSAGIPVHYCAEPFTNDGNIVNMVMKALKRMMAGEYARELSAKVYEGAKNLAKIGFRQGSSPGYGYRRLLVSPEGKPKGQLLAGQRKSLQEDRVVLAPGPVDEIHWIREIFRMYIDGRQPQEIAKALNACGVTYNGTGRHGWYREAVRRVLRSQKYTGCNVYGRSSQKLGSPRIKLPQSSWTIAPNSWPAIIDPAAFDSVQQIMAARNVRKSNEELVAELAALLKRKGRLSEGIVLQESGLPSQATYRGRFGSMSQAFALAGYNNGRVGAIDIRRQRRALRDRLLQDVVDSSNGRISIIQQDGHWKPRLQLPNGSVAAVYVSPSFKIGSGEVRWLLNAVPRERELISFIARLNTTNDGFQDYFVLPNLSRRTRWILTADQSDLKVGKQLSALSEFTSVVSEFLNEGAARSERPRLPL